MSMGMVNKDTAATIPAAGNTGDKVGNLAELHTTVKSDIVAAVNEVKDEQANKADNDIVADAFSAAETYAEGDYCTYEGGLYKFKTAHEGAWDAADVDQIQIAGELSELKNTLNDVIEGTTLSSLLTAIGNLKEVQKTRCIVNINNIRILRKTTNNYYISLYFDAGNNQFDMYQLSLVSSKLFHVTIPNTFVIASTEVEVTSWKIIPN